MWFFKKGKKQEQSPKMDYARFCEELYKTEPKFVSDERVFSFRERLGAAMSILPSEGEMPENAIVVANTLLEIAKDVAEPEAFLDLLKVALPFEGIMIDDSSMPQILLSLYGDYSKKYQLNRLEIAEKRRTALVAEKAKRNEIDPEAWMKETTRYRKAKERIDEELKSVKSNIISAENALRVIRKGTPDMKL